MLEQEPSDPSRVENRNVSDWGADRVRRYDGWNDDPPVALLVILREIAGVGSDLVGGRGAHLNGLLELKYDDAAARQNDDIRPAAILQGQFVLEDHTPVSACRFSDC